MSLMDRRPGGREAQRNKTSRRTVWLEGTTGYGLMLLSSLFDDPHSGLVEVLAWFFPLILRWTVGRLLVE